MDGDRHAAAATSARPSPAAQRPAPARQQRPVGWWLKEADAALDGAFEAAFREVGTSRRGWQVLTTLAAGPATRAELAEALVRFDAAAAVDGVVDDLVGRGWVSGTEPLALTDAGRAAEADLAGRVEQIRRRVGEALPEGDYQMLVQLLGRLAAAVR